MLGTKVLEERTSKFNKKIEVVRTLGMGTYIKVNGLTQSGGIVRNIWKQTLKKVKTLKPDAKSFLILGLGGGTVATLIDDYWPNAKITGVEIDGEMISLGKKYLGLVDRNIKIVIGDAKEFKSLDYDLVIVDVYCGDEFPKDFETDKFLKSLIKNKTVIFNRLYYGNKRPEAVKFGLKLKKYFNHVDYFYPEANMMIICSNTK